MSDKGVKFKESDQKTIGDIVKDDDAFVLQAVKIDPDLASAVYTEFNETSLLEIAKEIAPGIADPNYINQQDKQIENSVLSGLIAGISHVVLNDAIRQLPLVNAEKFSNDVPVSRGMSMGALINNIMLSQAEALRKSPEESTKINIVKLSKDIDEVGINAADEVNSNFLPMSTLFTKERVAPTGIIVGALGATLHSVLNKVFPASEVENQSQQVA